MARRMIDADIWEDDFVITLSVFERVLWIGLITTCADDQGRFINNPYIIRSKVFPADNISNAEIEVALKKFIAADKLLAYVDHEKNLLQIATWWRHQTPSWAAPSKYSPPDGWVDRVKIHEKGNRVFTYNWELPGGFQVPNPVYTPVPTPVPTDVARAIEDVKGDVKGEGEGVGKGEGTHDDADNYFSPDQKPLIEAFTSATGIYAPVGGGPQTKKWHQAVLSLVKARASPQEITATVQDMLERGLSIAGPWSILNGVNVYRSKQKARQNRGKNDPPITEEELLRSLNL